MDLAAIRIEPLGPEHDRSAFSCGEPALDRYLREQAGQDARRRVAAPFVASTDGMKVLGFYTLSATSIQLADVPVALAKKLPRYPRLPATLLGRLATDLSARGVGLGRLLLVDAIARAVRSASQNGGNWPVGVVKQTSRSLPASCRTPRHSRPLPICGKSMASS